VPPTSEIYCYKCSLVPSQPSIPGGLPRVQLFVVRSVQTCPETAPYNINSYVCCNVSQQGPCLGTCSHLTTVLDCRYRE
jgi:hypothetical protein